MAFCAEAVPNQGIASKTNLLPVPETDCLQKPLVHFQARRVDQRFAAEAFVVAECPSVGNLLTNLKFTRETENSIMDDALNRKVANPEVLDGWLEGVKNRDGVDGLAAVKAKL